MAETEGVINIPVHIATENAGPSFYRRSPSRQTPSMFTIRDNTVFQNPPSFDYNPIHNGIAGSVSPNGSGGINTGGHLSPPEQPQHRSVSPRLILKTNGTAVTSSPSPTLSNHKVSYDRQTLPVTSHSVESSSYPQPVMSPTPLPYSHYTSYSTVATPAAVYSNPRHVHRQPSQADSYASVPVSYGSVTNGSTPASEQHTLVNNFAVNKDAYKHLPVRSIERSASIGGDQNGLSNELPAAIFNIANSVKGSSTSSLDSPTTEQVKLPSVPSPPPPPPPPVIPEGGIPQPFRPVPSSAGSSAAPLSGLAAALKSATLKSVSSKVETSNIPAPMVTAKAGLMEEMQRKLARRKAKADGEDMTSVSSGSSRSSPFQAVPHTAVSTSNQHVLKPSYQQSSLPNNSQLNKKAAAESLPHQLEQLKQELMVEIKDDLEKLRQDIILAIEENK